MNLLEFKPLFDAGKVTGKIHGANILWLVHDSIFNNLMAVGYGNDRTDSLPRLTEVEQVYWLDPLEHIRYLLRKHNLDMTVTEFTVKAVENYDWYLKLMGEKQNE